MRTIKYSIMMLICLGVFTSSFAHINPERNTRKKTTSNYRMDCEQAGNQVDQNINNVRARLLAGGDVWWNGDDGLYIVPNVPDDPTPTSSIFAGAVWLGGVDPAGNLKVAAQTYGTASGESDFWTGPLDPINGAVDDETCADWDKHFRVLGTDIDLHLRNYQLAEAEVGPDEIVELDIDEIPEEVLGWPAKGNNHFFGIHDFELPNTEQGLAPFFDNDGDGNYTPEFGDYPIIEIRGCNDPQYPDEMFFWIYNDAGGVHTETNGDPIQMEIQVQAFAYATNDQLNNMTFQRYKLINRAVESIDSMYFAMWVDPDLGCFEDDYIGCDTTRDLMYVYNEDALDGQPNCSCTGGVNTYCDEVPILGVDYFRGPLAPKIFRNGELVTPPLGTSADTLVELGMSSFVYYNNGAIGNPTPGTDDPSIAAEYYNYLTGSWRDGTPFTQDGQGYGGTVPISYAFPDTPDSDGWSMCTAGLPNGDRRTLQASGPMRLDPGAVNELIIGVPWVAELDYPCPDISKLQIADDLSQALFDNCFDITDGPDAPDVCLVELDQELVFVLSNDVISSNNAFEAYSELDLRAPGTLPEDEKNYFFEGYKVFQLAGPEVGVADLDDPTKAQLVYQSDLKNGVDELYNWASTSNPDPDPDAELFQVWNPTLEVEGDDEGVGHTFVVTRDFIEDGALINHKKYYYLSIAYAYNNWEQFDPAFEGGEGFGQTKPYLEGRRNIQIYTAIPRPIIDVQVNSVYGDGAVITRLDGIGAGQNFLDMSDETRTAILDGSFDGTITYKSGQGPIDVKVVDPLRVQDGEYFLRFIDSDMNDRDLDIDARWEMTTPSGEVISTSDRDISRLNEQLIEGLGFSVSIAQSDDAGDVADDSNGSIGQTIEYADPTGPQWLTWVADDVLLSEEVPVAIDFLATGNGQIFNAKDPTVQLSHIGTQTFAPYTFGEYRLANLTQLAPLTPTWIDNNSAIISSRNTPDELNNVDIVFTSNPENWSRCIVVETATALYYDVNLGIGASTEGDARNLQLRRGASVGPNGQTDGDGTGMGWFPGYAIDVETGKRLNIFFGENSTYDGVDNAEFFEEGGATGRDMIWNPTSQIQLNLPTQSVSRALLGAQHYVYVTDQEYDRCEKLREEFNSTSPLVVLGRYERIKWAAMPYIAPGESLNSVGEGLIPNDLTVKVRVDNPYNAEPNAGNGGFPTGPTGTGTNDFHPAYSFKLEGKVAADNVQADHDKALDLINMVPNPYYGFSDYETSQFTNIVKITNLPAKCNVTIYSLDGKFIRQYKRDEIELSKAGSNPGIPTTQINPDIEWDLKNNKGIPVSSGVYLIHVDAFELGERTVKWFGVARKFDPSGL